MERFVFVAAIVIAVIFGIGALVRPHVNFDFDGEGMGTAELVALAPGSMPAATYAGTHVRIRSAAANITVIPEDRSDFSVEIDNSAGKAPMPDVSVDGDAVVIDGHLRGRISGCRDDGGASLRGYGDVAGVELPRITIRAPRTVNIDRSGAGSTDIGASQAVDLDLSGCGAATIGDVAGDFDLDLAGAAEVRAGTVRRFTADIAGAGDVTVGAVAQGANLDIAGAGSVTMASLNGDLATDAAGAGNVTIEAGSVGEANIDMAGSGDIDINAPVRRLVVSMVGAGDVTVTGEVGDLEAEIAGVGTVSVPRVTGSLRQEIHGPGRVNVGQ